MFSPQVGQADLASAAALFKNPVPTHGPKRNTACHQCRKRKLKCDTKRPCSTCVRSHQYALSHSTDGPDLPSEPECTYGDGNEGEKEPPPTGNKVEKLELRIVELESLLEQMQIALETSQRNGAATNGASKPNGTHTTARIVDTSTTIIPGAAAGPSSYQQSQPQEGWIDNIFLQNNTDLFDNLSQSFYIPETDAASSTSIQGSPTSENALVSMAVATTDRRSQLHMMGWPQHLPEPEITRHLVHAFFAFNIHAGRLFHGPTFLATLDLHPTDPRFPFSAVLHAMCAIGSMYTADIPQPPIQSRTQFPGSSTGLFFAVDELFPGRWRQYEQRPDSFAESHAKFARLAGEAALDRGENLLECLQTQVLLTWFYLSQARWSESYIASGQVLRCVVPCGFNICSPFHFRQTSWLQQPDCPPSILQDAQTITEDEMRRNVFWIAYSIERMQASGNSFAMALDDADVCQLLPVRGDQFETGVHVPMEDRQWSHDRKMLLYHPLAQTDSFILYIKSTILLSHVKNFNLRFRGRYFAGDAAMYSPSSSPSDELNTFDPRDTPAFQELDHLATSFRPSFPSHMKNPTQDDMVDPYLFSASSGAHLALILLHEPHANVTSPTCFSAKKMLKACRGMLDLMYGLSATSYDVTLVDHLPIFAWNVTGRALIRALKAAVDKNNFEQVVILHAEVVYVHDMLAKAGERVPLAYRYRKTVYDYLNNVCGRQFVESIPESSYRKRRFPSPQANIYDPAIFTNMFGMGQYQMANVQQASHV